MAQPPSEDSDILLLIQEVETYFICDQIKLLWRIEHRRHIMVNFKTSISEWQIDKWTHRKLGWRVLGEWIYRQLDLNLTNSGSSKILEITIKYMHSSVHWLLEADIHSHHSEKFLFRLINHFAFYIFTLQCYK